MTDDYDIKMFSQTTCGFCADTKKGIKEAIDSGKVKVIEVDKDPSGMALAKKLGINETPAFLVENKITKVKETCDITDDYKTLLCKGKNIELCK